MRYDAEVGFTYMPSTKVRMQRPDGGYLVRTNAAGFRSDREFIEHREPGAFRVLLFGDSQTAGDGVVNADRYSDLLERWLPGLEVNNYAVSGTGTDQQYLTYLQRRSVEHDLVIVALYAENIRRVSRRIVMSADADGDVTFRAKPYFTLDGDQLVVGNVPVPKQTWTEESLSEDERAHTLRFGDEYSARNATPQWMGGVVGLVQRLSADGPTRRLAKSVRHRVWGDRLHPLPEYDRPDGADWKLLRAILSAWVVESRVPVMVLLLPHETALTGKSDPTNYRTRLAELARDTGCQLVDALPCLAPTPDPSSVTWSSSSGHLTKAGHEAIAGLLAPLVRDRMSRT